MSKQVVKPTMRYCFNCGEELGVMKSIDYDPLDTCGKAECEREARWAAQADRDARFAEAEQDDFQRYGGRW